MARQRGCYPIEADKTIHARVLEIFSNPQKHTFFSEAEAPGKVGPRGGKITGRKRVCAHCGGRASVHNQCTERL